MNIEKPIFWTDLKIDFEKYLTFNNDLFIFIHFGIKIMFNFFMF